MPTEKVGGMCFELSGLLVKEVLREFNYGEVIRIG